MFCPNCGKADQKQNSYCRSCGEFLPDSTGTVKPVLTVNTPVEKINKKIYLNLLASAMSVFIGFFLLYVHLQRRDNNPLIWIVASYLVATGIWQFSNFVSEIKLKKHFKARKQAVDEAVSETETKARAFQAQPRTLLNEPDLDLAVPASVTERTTKNLDDKVTLPKSEQ